MAEVVFNDYMPKIWNDLMYEFNNEIGVAGLMGNLYAESGCTPYACQPTRPYDVCMTYIANLNNHSISKNDFVHYGCSPSGGVSDVQLGFGLAQWTFPSRKAGFYDFMYANGSDISDLGNQIGYVIEEITSNAGLDSAIRNATSLDAVSDYVLAVYENPKNQSEAVKSKRRGYGTDIFTQYSGTVPVEPSHPQPPSTDRSPISPSDSISDTASIGNRLRKQMPLWMMLRNKYFT